MSGPWHLVTPLVVNGLNIIPISVGCLRPVKRFINSTYYKVGPLGVISKVTRKVITPLVGGEITPFKTSRCPPCNKLRSLPAGLSSFLNYLHSGRQTPWKIPVFPIVSTFKIVKTAMAMFVYRNVSNYYISVNPCVIFSVI